MRPTFLQLFVAISVAFALGAGGVLAGIAEVARRAAVAQAERRREAMAGRVEALVEADLGQASAVLRRLEVAIVVGALRPDRPEAMRGPLLAALLDSPSVADISFTAARVGGFDAAGEAILARDGRWQVSATRADEATGAVETSRTAWVNDHFEAVVQRHPPGGGLADGPQTRLVTPVDPTEHLTFQTLVSRSFYGRPLWSDLQYFDKDVGLPEAQRRVVVSLQKALLGGDGRLLGVARVSLRLAAIDRLGALQVDELGDGAAHRVFVADRDGRLISRLGPADAVREVDDELRVAAVALPPEVAMALRQPALAQLSEARPQASGALVVGGRRHLYTLRLLPGGRGWVVGLVAPEAGYTRDLMQLRDRFLTAGVLAALVALGVGLAVLQAVRAGLAQLLAACAQMRAFDFAAAPVAARLRDIDDVAQGLERAKTALRALGRYVPMDLVRQLVAANREPQLGGEMRELTVMFTDIEGFTTIAEQLPPDALAVALGDYFAAMAAAIGRADGTIDKFIGDAVMALWNAPAPVADHPRRACAGALACAAATTALQLQPSWAGRPRFATRCGLHTGAVLVGHFGAPERLSYTALGDGVNLASRLEGLCKQYGVAIVVSETVRRGAGDAFVFRCLDRVAVQGKAQALTVYELCGPAGLPPAPHLATYEAAWAHYGRRDFAAAAALLAPQAGIDPPSAALLRRCVAYAQAPPPADWDGVWSAPSK